MQLLVDRLKITLCLWVRVHRAVEVVAVAGAIGLCGQEVDEIEPEFLGEMPDLSVILVDQFAAVLRDLPVDPAAAVGPASAAEPIGRFEHGRRVSGLAQRIGCSQSGETRPDDRNTRAPGRRRRAGHGQGGHANPDRRRALQQLPPSQQRRFAVATSFVRDFAGQPLQAVEHRGTRHVYASGVWSRPQWLER